jgi:hypothetical protein
MDNFFMYQALTMYCTDCIEFLCCLTIELEEYECVIFVFQNPCVFPVTE